MSDFQEIKLKIKDNQVVIDQASLEYIIIYIINNILTKLNLVSLLDNKLINNKTKTKKTKIANKAMADLDLTSLTSLINLETNSNTTLSPLNPPSLLKELIGEFLRITEERYGYKYKISPKDASVAKKFLQRNSLDFGKQLINYFFDVMLKSNKSLPVSLALALSIYSENQYMFSWNKKKWEWGTENPPLDKKWWL
jgi:hypothetical protein